MLSIVLHFCGLIKRVIFINCLNMLQLYCLPVELCGIHPFNTTRELQTIIILGILLSKILIKDNTRI